MRFVITKECMIREKDLSLEKALDICRAAESARTQMKEMSQEDSDVHEIRRTSASQNNEHSSNNNSNNNRNTDTNSQQVSSDRQCFNCHGYGHLSRDCPSGDVFPRGRGRGTSRGNQGGRSRGRGPGRGRGRGRRRRYNVNEIEEEIEEDENAYEDQFNLLSLHSVTSESSERGRTTARGNQHVRSRGHDRGHRGPEELFEEQFQTFTLDSVTAAVESVTNGKQLKKRQRFARLKFYNLVNKKSKFTSGALKIDSGAEMNTMPLKEYKRLYPDRFSPDGEPIAAYIARDDDIKLKGYGGNYVEQLGKVKLPCEYNGRKFMCTFFLANVDGPSLMGLPTGEALGIIKIDVVDEISADDEKGDDDEDESVVSVDAKYVETNTHIQDRPAIKSKADLKVMYPECFEVNKRCFPDFEYNISVDKSIKPSVKPVRRLPLELKEPVKKELDRMIQKGVIVPVVEPTEWVSSMVVEHKPNGGIRICLDPTDLNRAIKREHYPSPHIDDLAHRLKGADMFTKLDAKDGYWNIKLSETSSYLTTFNTPWGR